MYFLYSLLLGLALLISSPYWLWQMARTGKHRMGLGERFGRVPERIRRDARPTVWVHAVSVGEVLAASGLVPELRARLPQRRVVISTTTATGQKLARERFGAENVFYFPLDVRFAVRSWLRALRPELVVLAETEFWPNFLHLARTSGACIAVVNARISDRSRPRYRRIRGIMASVLANIDLFLAQSEEDRRRLVEIGARPERVQVSGNLKFDVRPATMPPIVEALRSAVAHAGLGPVVVCGSTVEGEESLLVPALRAVLQSWPKALVILAPRHPERFEQVARLLVSSGLRFWRRSGWNAVGEAPPLAGGVFLLDSIGELAWTYTLANVAFVGGSLVPRGGHNVLEAAQAGAAVLVGPHTENFRDIITLFRRADALRVASADEIGPAMIALLEDDAARTALTHRAAEVLRAHSGASERTLAALAGLLGKTSEVVRR